MLRSEWQNKHNVYVSASTHRDWVARRYSRPKLVALGAGPHSALGDAGLLTVAASKLQWFAPLAGLGKLLLIGTPSWCNTARGAFAALMQEIFGLYMQQQRALNPRTVASCRDTFVLLLRYAEESLSLSAHNRKAWLFAGSELASQRAAKVMSLVQSSKLNGNDPWGYPGHVRTGGGNHIAGRRSPERPRAPPAGSSCRRWPLTEA